MIGPTAQGFDDLRLSDPTAVWNPTPAPGDITGSCAPSCAPESPRVVPIPVFDMDDFQFHRAGGGGGGGNPGESGAWSHCPTGGKCIRVVNILGFFADRIVGNDIIGYLRTQPGEFVVGPPSPVGTNAFLINISLIR